MKYSSTQLNVIKRNYKVFYCKNINYFRISTTLYHTLDIRHCLYISHMYTFIFVFVFICLCVYYMDKGKDDNLNKD